MRLLGTTLAAAGGVLAVLAYEVLVSD